MATIRETRIAIKKRKEAEAKIEADRKAKAEAEAAAKAEAEKEDDSSILDTFRKFFSTDDSSADAIEAIERGISEADVVNQRNKK